MKWKFVTYILSLVFFTSIILGVFSIRPFTKLLLPWMIFDQWKKIKYPPTYNYLCIENLRKQGGIFIEGKVPDSDIQRGCTIDTIVIVSHLNLKLTNIAYPPQANFVSLSCEFATELLSFINSTLVQASIKHFNKSPTALLHKGGYACRGQRDFTIIKSEHAFAQAIDFAGVLLEDGTEILVENDFGKDNPAGRFLNEIATKSCDFFGTNLGPKFNDLHKDHLHWSIGFPRICI